MSADQPRARIALYSHDTVGLGHTRRQLAIAAALSRHHPDADLLLLTGNPEAARLPVPERTDLVTVPTVTKAATGGYVPRRLGTDLEKVIGLRQSILTAVLDEFVPDLLIVDKVPQGLCGELLPALELLRGRSKVVLGLREVLDDPETTNTEWRTDAVEDLVRDHYDEVWVYGDRSVFDPAKEYAWGHSVTEKTQYLGYLGHEPSRPRTRIAVTDGPGGEPVGPYVLCQTGGGADGEALAQAFLNAPLPNGYTGVVLTGPYLPERQRSRLQAMAEGTGRHRVLGFTEEAEAWLDGAAAVVSMGGYNSTVEILSSEIPALIVPRIHPRQEQLIRAAALEATGALDLIRPQDATPERLEDWLAAVLTPADQPDRSDQPDHTPRTAERTRQRMIAARTHLNLSGLDALLHRTDTLIGVSTHAA